LVNGLLHDRKPVAVIGLGGYAAGAAVKCAAKAKIPTALINPDVVPGKANQYLLRRARIMCCQFEQTRQFVPGSQRHKLRITGCPIRGEFAQLPSRQEAAGRLGLDPLLRTLVVTGASLGAQTINEAVLEVLKTTKPQGWQILHLAGRDHGPKVSAGYQGLGMGARVIGFSVAMADVWAVADLAISRSGASSCAEMTACGVPSILMPYPFHKDQHQKLNARVLAEAGAAVMIDDQRDPRQNAQTLRPVMEGLLFDANKRQTMAARAKAMGKIAAAGSVAQAITELIDTCR